MQETPTFLQGIYEFEGTGLGKPVSFPAAITYTVPFDKRAQFVYFRAGNSADALVYLVMMRAGAPMRYFPVGAKAGIHVPLSVVEDIEPDTKLELLFAAPEGVKGTLVIDIGLVEI